MTTAYGGSLTGVKNKGQSYGHLLPFIPLRQYLRDGSSLTIDFVRDEEDVEAIKTLLNDAIETGASWPFENRLSDRALRDYFFSHTALVARIASGKVVGAFYCKPNFPGRCSHYCNGGFITDPSYRRRGIGSSMGRVFLRVAQSLGFQAVLFNLVFSENKASIALWDGLGFTPLARLPRVGRLKQGYSDAVQYYYDLKVVGKPPANREREVFRPALSRLPMFCAGVIVFLLGRAVGVRHAKGM